MGIVRYEVGSYCSVGRDKVSTQQGPRLGVRFRTSVVFSCIFPLRKPLQMPTPPHQSRVPVRVVMQNMYSCCSKSTH